MGKSKRSEEGAAKTRKLQLRLDSSTEAAIRSRAAAAGLSMSAYVRSCCLEVKIRPVKPGLLYELNRIAHALNEIARRANAARGVDVAVLESLLEIEHEVLRLS
jgi:hypothetical protein